MPVHNKKTEGSVNMATSATEALATAAQAAAGKSNVRDAVQSVEIEKEKEPWILKTGEAVRKNLQANGIDAWVTIQYADRLSDPVMAGFYGLPEGLSTATVGVFFADENRKPIMFAHTNEYNDVQKSVGAHCEVIEFKSAGDKTSETDFTNVFASKMRGVGEVVIGKMDEISSPSVMVPASFVEKIYEITKIRCRALNEVRECATPSGLTVEIKVEQKEEKKAKPPAMPRLSFTRDQVREHMRKNGIDAWVTYNCPKLLKNDAALAAFGLPEGLEDATVSVFLADEKKLPLVFVSKRDLEAHKGEFAETTKHCKIIAYNEESDLKERLDSHLPRSNKVAVEISDDFFSPGAMAPREFCELVQRLTNCEETVPSIGIIQNAVVPVTEAELKEHRDAARKLGTIFEEAKGLIKKSLAERIRVTEYDVLEFINQRYEHYGMHSEFRPYVNVSVNEHIADVHYKTTKENTSEIKKGDVILMDIWAANKNENGVFADVTKMFFVGREEDVPEEYAKAHAVQVQEVKWVMNYLTTTIKRGDPIVPSAIDLFVHQHMLKNGYVPHPHSTGHNMTIFSVHGAGVRMHYTVNTPMALNSLYTIEPGIYVTRTDYDVGGTPTKVYLYGARTEVNVYLDPKLGAVLTTPFALQEKIECLY